MIKQNSLSGEMAEILMFRLTEKKLVAESITLEVGYDRENVDKGGYRGLTQTDRYGTNHPQGGTRHRSGLMPLPNLGSTSSTKAQSCLSASPTRR